MMAPAAFVVILAVFLVQTTDSREISPNVHGVERAAREIDPKSSDHKVHVSHSLPAPSPYTDLNGDFLLQKVKTDGFFSALFMVIGRSFRSFFAAGWQFIITPFNLLRTSLYGLKVLFKQA